MKFSEYLKFETNLADFKIAIYADLEMNKIKCQFIISYFTKIVESSNNCIQSTPIDMLGNMQKEIFKKLPSWLLQDAHGLPH